MVGEQLASEIHRVTVYQGHHSGKPTPASAVDSPTSFTDDNVGNSSFVLKS